MSCLNIWQRNVHCVSKVHYLQRYILKFFKHCYILKLKLIFTLWGTIVPKWDWVHVCMLVCVYVCWYVCMYVCMLDGVGKNAKNWVQLYPFVGVNIKS